MTPQLHPFLLLVLLLLSPISTVSRTSGGVPPLMQTLVQVNHPPTAIFFPQEGLYVTDAGDCYGGEYGGCQPLDIQGGRCGLVWLVSFDETQNRVYGQV